MRYSEELPQTAMRQGSQVSGAVDAQPSAPRGRGGAGNDAVSQRNEADLDRH